MDDAEIGEMTFAAPSAHASTVLLSDGRRIELSRDGEGFQGYIANEDGRRRAFMVLSNIVHSGKVFTRLGTNYLVKLSDEPYSQIAMSRLGGQPGVIIMRSCRNSAEPISQIRQGDFGREELITLLTLAAFYLLTNL
jgi:hypothetical protein